jgi:hypothetical protein
MFDCQARLRLLLAVLLFAAPWANRLTPAANRDASKDGTKVAGILIDKKNDSITVKADGEAEPVKYLIADARVAEAMKSIFNACRVQLTYKQNDGSRQLVGIKRQILKASGTVTGDVVKVYNDFWVEVKPKHGLSDAYAPGANFNDKEFMGRLKGLKEGDSVTITYFTDFERHRIKTLRINAKSPSKPASAVPSAAPSNQPTNP